MKCRRCFHERFSVEWLKAQVTALCDEVHATADSDDDPAYELGRLEGKLKFVLPELAERLCRCEEEPMLTPKRARTWSRHIPGCRVKIAHQSGMPPTLCPACGRVWSAA
jgi:hypothetical protein